MSWTPWSTGPPTTSTSPTDVREICLAHLDKTRTAMTKVTVAPITSTAKGLSSEVPVGPANGLEHDSVISLDNVVTIPVSMLGRNVGFLSPDQEAHLARAVVLAYDLDIALLDT
jgi:mRNA interferase MazF